MGARVANDAGSGLTMGGGRWRWVGYLRQEGVNHGVPLSRGPVRDLVVNGQAVD